MSGNFGGPSPFGEQNPYGSPQYASQPKPPGKVPGKVMAPAIALIVACVIGIGLSIFNVISSFNPPQVDPNAPPFVQEIQKGTSGPQARIIQSGFILLNTFIVIGAVQMLRMKTWGLALAATIAGMVNIGSCCCLLTLPFGIWALVILLQPDVKSSFS